MKLLHTSDWHLGHNLYSHDRTDEFLDFFDQLEKIIASEQPDALLVSGDIYDVTAPSAAVAKMFKDEILRIHDIAPAMTIVITAGNHDSATRVDVDRNLWRVGGIHVIGGVARNGRDYDFKENIIPVGDKGYIAAIPFVNTVFMPRPDDGSRPERRFFFEVAKALEWQNSKGLPTVLMAHLSVENCDRRGHRDNVIGGVESVPTSCFPESFNYVALGHIHKPQTFADGRIAYSGAPIPISFDEDYPHSVYVVNVEKGSAPEIIEKTIKPLRELKLVPPEALPFKEALKKLKKYPADDDCYIRFHVGQEGDLPADCTEQAVAALRDKKARFCTIKKDERPREGEAAAISHMSVAEFTETTPADIARRFFASENVAPETIEEYASMLQEIEQEILNDNNQ